MSVSTFKRRHLNAWVAAEAERWIPGDVIGIALATWGNLV
jgi:hypothetical protein